MNKISQQKVCGINKNEILFEKNFGGAEYKLEKRTKGVRQKASRK